MPKLSQQVNVTVTDKGRVGEKRKASVDLEADSELFTLSDMLAREGALKDLKAVLASAMRDAVGKYIGSGRRLLREASRGNGRKSGGVAENKKQDKRAGTLLL